MNRKSEFVGSAQNISSATQDENGQADVVDRTQTCTNGSQRENGHWYRQHDVASSQDENNQPDVLDNKQSCSDLSDTNDKQGQKSSVTNQCDSAHTAARTQNENDPSDLLDNSQSGTAKSPEANDESNVTNSNLLDAAGLQDEIDQSDASDNSQSGTAKSQEAHDESNITSSNLLDAAGLQDENDQSDVSDNSQSCTTNNVQEGNDISSLTYSKLLNNAGSEQKSDKSDLSDNMQLCTINACDQHIVNQETAIQQPGEIERPLNMAVPVNMQQFMLQMRPENMDVTVNETTVVGNKNTIVQGNPEEHSETLHAISASTDQITNEHEEQTTSLKQEMQGSERRLTRVIVDEGEHITTTVTNTGYDVSGRIDETKERVNNLQESVERKQSDTEFQIAKIKQQNVDLARDTEENASYAANKSTEAQKEAIEQSVNKTTENISKEIHKVKADISDTEQKLLRAVKEQEKEMVHMTQKLTNVMKQSGDDLTECIHTAKEDTTEAIKCLKGSVDSLAGEITALKQTFTNQIAELQASIKISNKYHKKAIKKVSRQCGNIKRKIGNMEELALETTVNQGKNVIIDTVCKSVKRSEGRLLDALLY